MKPSSHLESPWPHRLAVVLVCATFPLIWVGGLVTTYDAGMAVPDWPTTYGYNLFLYPLETWIAGPWDLFIEHGHRLLGALVGMITIALTVAVFWRDSRLWMRFAVVAALCLVIAQGVIGGQRVLLDARQLAKLHGCLGPAFFALATSLAVFTSRVWRNGPAVPARQSAGKLHRLAVLTAALAYVQLVLGAHLRHIPVTAGPGEFRAALLFHLLGAAAVAVHVGLLAAHVLRNYRDAAPLRRPAVVLALLILLQLTLGLGTWVVKYSSPFETGALAALRGITFTADGMAQALTVTAHTAGGSLVLAIAVMLALRAMRLAPRGTESAAMTMKNTSEQTSRAVEATA